MVLFKQKHLIQVSLNTKNLIKALFNIKKYHQSIKKSLKQSRVLFNLI